MNSCVHILLFILGLCTTTRSAPKRKANCLHIIFNLDNMHLRKIFATDNRPSKSSASTRFLAICTACLCSSSLGSPRIPILSYWDSKARRQNTASLSSLNNFKNSLVSLHLVGVSTAEYSPTRLRLYLQHTSENTYIYTHVCTDRKADAGNASHYNLRIIFE